MMALAAQLRSGLAAIRRSQWLSPIFRFVAWWFSLFALLGPLSVCPFCGQPGCGVGGASAGLLGGIIAAVISIRRRIFGFSKGCTLHAHAHGEHDTKS